MMGVDQVIQLILAHPMHGLSVAFAGIAVGLGTYWLKRIDDGKPVSAATKAVLGVSVAGAIASIMAALLIRPSVGPDTPSLNTTSNVMVATNATMTTTNEGLTHDGPGDGYSPDTAAADELVIRQALLQHGTYIRQGLTSSLPSVQVTESADFDGDSIVFRHVSSAIINGALGDPTLAAFRAKFTDLDPATDVAPGLNNTTTITFRCKSQSGNCFKWDNDIGPPPTAFVTTKMSNVVLDYAPHSKDLLDLRRAFERLVSDGHDDNVVCKAALSDSASPKCEYNRQ